MRVPSNLDLVLNAGGAVMGATAAVLLERLGGLRRWSQFRADWLVPRAQGSLVLLALWPMALLYPVSVPYGLGQVWSRLEAGLVRLLDGTPFLAWLPVRPAPPAPLSLLAEAFCVGLALLTPSVDGLRRRAHGLAPGCFSVPVLRLCAERGRPVVDPDLRAGASLGLAHAASRARAC